MGMFDYKQFSSAQSAEMANTTHKLATFTNAHSLMFLPMNKIFNSLGGKLGDFTANPIEMKIPDGWKELKPADLGLPDSAMDKLGYFKITSPITGNLSVSGPQAKIFAEYDNSGKMTRVSVVFCGTNDLPDVLDYLQLNSGEMAKHFNPLMTAVKELCQQNGLSGEDVLVTGYSLGGGMVNIMAKYREMLADGFFNDTNYIGHAAPYIFNDKNVVLNVGYENDVVHRLVGDHPDLLSAIKDGKGIMINNDHQFESSTDNLVIFDDLYASKLWDISPFTLFNLVGWEGHLQGMITDAIPRISQSAFYEYTNQDSTVIVSQLTAASRGKVWVQDKTTHTSDHHGKPAFIIGTQYNDLLQSGAKDDYIDGGKGDDQIKLASGNDRVEGGEGTDNLILNDHAQDWNVYKLSDDTLFFDNVEHGLKQAHGVEQVTFWKDFSSENPMYTIGSDGLNSITGSAVKEYSEMTEGTAGNDTLTGKVVFAQGGNDALQALDTGSLLHGGEGNDILLGKDGNDRLYGAEGNDLLVGGKGTNYLSGGVGNDTFAFNETVGKNTISDFDAHSGEQDKLLFNKALFANQDALVQATKQVGDDVVVSYQGFELSVQDTTVDQMLQASSIV